jgi:hypothetical protein
MFEGYSVVVIFSSLLFYPSDVPDGFGTVETSSAYVKLYCPLYGMCGGVEMVDGFGSVWAKVPFFYIEFYSESFSSRFTGNCS